MTPTNTECTGAKLSFSRELNARRDAGVSPKSDWKETDTLAELNEQLDSLDDDLTIYLKKSMTGRKFLAVSCRSGKGGS